VTAFTVARNSRTSLYEVHTAGCAHLISKHLEVGGTFDAENAAEFAAAYEAGNDGILTTLGPCAKQYDKKRGQ
jgi:hypothetical protein